MTPNGPSSNLQTPPQNGPIVANQQMDPALMAALARKMGQPQPQFGGASPGPTPPPPIPATMEQLRLAQAEAGTQGAVQNFASHQDATAQGNWPSPDQGQLEPYTPQRLLDMYRAWQQAKYDEVQEQYSAWRYYHDKQWTDAEIAELKKRKQPILTDNLIKPKVNFLVGLEQKFRRDPAAYPRTPKAEDKADLATNALRFAADATHFAQMASDCTLDAMVTGLCAVAMDVDAKTKDPVKKRVPPERWFYDPRSLEYDFSDARYVGTHGWYDEEALIEMMGPEIAEKLETVASQAKGVKLGDVGLNPTDQVKEHNWCDPNTNRYRVMEIWYKHKGWWLWAIQVHQTKLAEGVSPYLNVKGESMHRFEGVSLYIDERGDRYGIIRSLKSPQDEINKRKSKSLHLLSVRQTKAPKGVVADVPKMKRELAMPDGHVEYAPSPLGQLEILNNTDQTQGHMLLLQQAQAAITNLGPNPALVGDGSNDESGRAILAKQNAGLMELSPVMERIRDWKLRCYRHDWFLIRQFWNEPRWLRVLGDDGQPQFFGLNQPAMMQDGSPAINPQTGQQLVINQIGELDVDIVIDEGPDVITIQQEEFAKLMDLAKAYGPQAVPFPIAVEMSGLRNKKQLLAKLQQASQEDPLQQQEKQLKIADAAATVQQKQTAAQLNVARAQDLGQRAQFDTARHAADWQKSQVGTQMDVARLHMEARGQDLEHERTLADYQSKLRQDAIDAHQAETDRLKAHAALISARNRGNGSKPN